MSFRHLSGAALCVCLAALAKPVSAQSLGDYVVRAGVEASAYSDSDHVAVATPSISVAIENPLDKWSLSGSYLVDVVTAASVDIVATASPRWTEVRHGGAIGGEFSVADWRFSGAAGISLEPDYLSLGVSAGAAVELLDKSVLLGARYVFSHDTAGRSDTPFEVFALVAQRHNVSANVALTLASASQLSLFGDTVIERGDQAKPYRYLPLFDQTAAAQLTPGASPDTVNVLRLAARTRERLPLERERFAFGARLAHRFSASTLRLSQRLYGDTWGIWAATTDIRYIFDFGERIALWPHLRAHGQTAATFYRLAYIAKRNPDNELAIPSLRTGDRELGPYVKVTGGAGIEVDVSERAGQRDWLIGLSADGILTQFFEALYITRRSGLFAALTLKAEFK